MSSWYEKVSVQVGRAAEIAVGELMMLRGNYVVPSYDYSGLDEGKPPRLQGKLRGYVIPDLDVAKDGKRRWFEVKAKTEPSQTWSSRLTGVKGIVPAHGVAKRLVDNYAAVERITGTPVYLVIVEKISDTWLWQRLAVLRKGKEWETISAKMGHMVFWPRVAFRVLDRKVKK